MNETKTNQPEEIIPKESIADTSLPEDQPAVVVAEPEITATEATEPEDAVTELPENEEKELLNNGTVLEESTATPKKNVRISKKTILFVCSGVFAAAVIIFVILFFSVIKPNSIYNDAVSALDRGDFVQCEQLLREIPNHKGTYELSQKATIAKAKSYIDEGELDIADSLLVSLTGVEEAKLLRQDIQYLKAVDLVDRKDYDEATIILDKIPNHNDPEKLREQISYATAIASLENGDYKTAYEIFSQLGDYKDSVTQKEIVYYEALAFKSLFNIQSTLKNPASMYITKVTFYQDSSNENELDAIFEFNATNSYGGSLGAYGYDLTLYDDSEDSGMISQSAYADPDDYIELLYQMLIDSIKKQTEFKTTVDIARMNRLLKGDASFNIDLPFQSAEVVES